jgi:hypothetical protein
MESSAESHGSDVAETSIDGLERRARHASGEVYALKYADLLL